MGAGLLMPSFIAIIVGGVGSPHRNLGRRAADRRRLGRYRGVLPGGERGDHVRADGGGAAGAAARLVRRGRHADVSKLLKPESRRKLAALVAIWTALVLAPFWMPLLGGYTALGDARPRARAGRDVGEFPVGLYRRAVFRPRRLVRHRRLWLRHDPQIRRAFDAARNPRRDAGGRPRRRGARRADRAPARRLFRHGDHRLRPSVLLHRLPVVVGHRRRRRLAPRSTASRCIWASPPSTSSTTRPRSIISCWSASRSPSAAMAFILRSPFGRTMLAIRENERRARFLGIPVELHIWIAFTLAASSWPMPDRSTRWSTTSPTPAACITASRAIS